MTLLLENSMSGLDNNLVLANIQLNSTGDASSFRRHNTYSA